MSEHPKSSTAVAAQSQLRRLDADAISAGARVETRNREVHLPPVSAYRWWARRTEAVNGGILDAMDSEKLLVVDPFAGGGVIPLAAVKRGHRVYAQDLNPWAASGLAGMMSLASVGLLKPAGERLREQAQDLLARAYVTTYSDGAGALISHTFRVASAPCPNCDTTMRLFPHALVSLRARRERGRDDAFLACPAGHVVEGHGGVVMDCPQCGRQIDPAADYTRRREVACPECGTTSRLEQLASGEGWGWQVVLVERVDGRRRELGLPSAAEVAQAADGWNPRTRLSAIPVGQETNVILRHGFRTWDDIYPARQRVVIEELLALAADLDESQAVKRALSLAILGSTEMAGLLSRWDRFYLKSYESMAGHRFNFTTFTAEPNVWGTSGSGRGSVMRRLVSLEKASRWFAAQGIDKLRVKGPAQASGAIDGFPTDADIAVVEGSSERMLLETDEADLVLTDPPYHDDVQYDELSLPLRAWAELSLDRLEGEAVANASTGNNSGIDDYRDLLARIYSECHRVLRADGHLIFSFANREPSAWRAVLSALDRAGFRACGFAVLHSENETDVVKRDVRACTLDFLMDLVPAECDVPTPYVPATLPATPEGAFLRIVGDAFMKVGDLDEDALDALEASLRASDFIAK